MNDRLFLSNVSKCNSIASFTQLSPVGVSGFGNSASGADFAFARSEIFVINTFYLIH